MLGAPAVSMLLPCVRSWRLQASTAADDKPGEQPRLVTDHCRFMAIEQNADNNAIPACEDNLQPYWVNVMDSTSTAISARIS